MFVIWPNIHNLRIKIMMKRVKETMGGRPADEVPDEARPLLKILRFTFGSILHVIPLKGTQPSVIEGKMISSVCACPKHEIDRLKGLLIEGKAPEFVIRKELHLEMSADETLIGEIWDRIRTLRVTDTIVYGVFYEALAWMGSDVRDREFFVTLIRIMSEFLSSSDIGLYEKELNFIVKMMVITYVEDRRLKVNDSVTGAICAHLISNDTVKEDFFDTFCSFCCWIFESGVRGSVVRLLKTCGTLLTGKRKYIDMTDGSRFLRMVLQLVKRLDVHAIRLICSARPQEMVSNEINEAFRCLAGDIITMLKDQKETHKKLEIDEGDDLPLEGPAKVYKFIESQGIEHDRSGLTLKDNENQHDLIVSPAYRSAGLDAFAEWFPKAHEHNILTFLREYSESMEQHIHSPYYLDIYATYLRFASFFPNREFLARSWSALMSPIVFHRSYTLFGECHPVIRMLRTAIFKFADIHMSVWIDILCFVGKKSPWLCAEALLQLMTSLSDVDLYMFNEERVIRLVTASALSLQHEYTVKPTKECRMVQMICLDFMVKLMSNSDVFLRLCDSHVFVDGYLHFLFETGVEKVVIDGLKNGFMNSHHDCKQPLYTYMVASLRAIVDICGECSGIDNYGRLAKGIFDCILSSLLVNAGLIYSFAPMFVTLLRYVDKQFDKNLALNCIKLLTIQARNINGFRFTYQTFGLMDSITIRLGLDTLKSEFLELVSGVTGTNRASIYIIEHPILLSLLLVAYRGSPELIDVINYFAMLCRHSPENCVACHDGEVDFILSELLLSKSNCVVFYGCTVQFEISNTHDVIAGVLDLIGLILGVRTSSVICDRLFRLLYDKDECMPYQYAEIIGEFMYEAAATGSKKMGPLFNLYPSRMICEFTGLTEADVNDGMWMTMWINISELETGRCGLLEIMRLCSDSHTSMVHLSLENGKLAFLFRSDVETRVTLSSSMVLNEWVNYSVHTTRTDNELYLSFFRFNEQVEMVSVPKFEFPPGPVKCILGGEKGSTGMSTISGALGPFAFSGNTGKNHMSFLTYPFHLDRNFEAMEEARFTSNMLRYPASSGGVEVKQFREPVIGHGFPETMVDEYKLNSLVFQLDTLEWDTRRALWVLRIIIQCCCLSLPGQFSFHSAPVLASCIIRIFGSKADYCLYVLLYNLITKCMNETIRDDLICNIVLNMDIWMRTDCDSLERIIEHWGSSVVVKYPSVTTTYFSVKQLLGRVKSMFMTKPPVVVVEKGNDHGVQASLLDDLDESSMLSKVYTFHTEDEAVRILSVYILYIRAVASFSCTADDVDAIYSGMLQTPRKEDKLVYLEIVRVIGHIIIYVGDLQFDPIVPLQMFFNTNDADLVVAGVRALNTTAKDLDLAVSAASLQIPLNADIEATFEKLTKLVSEYNTVFSLICTLSLKMAASEQRRALDVLHHLTVNANSTFPVPLRHLTLFGPIALGLISNEEGCWEVANFLSMLVSTDTDQVQCLEMILHMVGLIAVDRIIPAARLSRLIGVAVCRDATLNQARQKYVPQFLCVCFQNVFFELTDKLHNRFLLGRVRDSPFAEPVAEADEPVSDLMTLMDIIKAKMTSTKPNFSVRVNEDGLWMDKEFVLVLVSMASQFKEDQLLMRYVKLAEILNGPMDKNKITFGGILKNTIDGLMKTVNFFDEPAFNAALHQKVLVLKKIVYEGLSGCHSRIKDIEQEVVRGELDSVQNTITRVCRIRSKVFKDVRCQRDISKLFSEDPVVFERNDTIHFALCPSRLKPFVGCDTATPASMNDKGTQTTGDDATWGTLDHFMTCVLVKAGREVPARFGFESNGWALQTESGDIARGLYGDILSIMPMSRYQHMTSLGLQLRTGIRYVIDFGSRTIDDVVIMFLSRQVPFVQLTDTKQAWIDRKVSNFAYLMHLNTVSCRSFDDIMQYPVFPKLLTDEGPRDLSKPACYSGIDPWSISSANELESVFHESVLSPAAVVRMLSRIEPFAALYEGGNMGDTDDVDTELPADYFFEPEIFGNSKEALMKVYELRKLLETDEISASLHHWIDLIFGVNQQGQCATDVNNFRHPFILEDVWQRASSKQVQANEQVCSLMRIYGLMPNRVLRSEHEPRNERLRCNARTSRHNLCTKFLSTVFRTNKDKIVTVTKDGCAQPIALDPHYLEFSVEREFALVDPTLTGDIIATVDGCVLIYDAELKRLMLVGECELVETAVSVNVNGAASDGRVFAVLSNRTTFAVYDRLTFPRRMAKLSISEDIITCFAVSDVFRLLCYVTRKGHLHFMSIDGMMRTMVVQMPTPSACSALISRTWGFVVVDSGSCFQLFTVNGMYIGQHDYEESVVYWTTLSSVSDFDYVAYVNVRGELRLFGICEPDKPRVIPDIPSSVCFIDYMVNGDVLVVVTSTANVLVIPNPFPAL